MSKYRTPYNAQLCILLYILYTYQQHAHIASGVHIAHTFPEQDTHAHEMHIFLFYFYVTLRVQIRCFF